MRATYRAGTMLSLASVAVLASSNVAGATIGDESKCRATIAKTQTKLTATVGKNQRSCTKSVLKGKRELMPGEKCHQNSTSDVKDKAQKAADKLRASVSGGLKSKCADGTDTITLAGFQPSCMVGVGGAPLAIGNYADVAECQVAAAIGAAELVFAEIVNPDYAAILDSSEIKGLSKCVDAIAKNATKLMATYGKSRAKAQNAVDKNSAAPTAGYGHYNAADSKITSAIAKMRAGIAKGCVDSSKTPLDSELLVLVGSCSSCLNGQFGCVVSIEDCVAKAVHDVGEGVVSMAYVATGEFPATASATVRSGSSAGGGFTVGGASPGGRRSKTRLSSGFTGFGHGADLTDGLSVGVSLDCGGDGICDILPDCSQRNCRCASPNNDVECNEPFGPDVDDCGGADCELRFGPAQPMNVSSTPICVRMIVEGLGGSVDLADGNTDALVQARDVVYQDEGGQSQPCPTCDGDATPNDGLKEGTCAGGENDGDPCDENGLHATFGPTSYDCDPDSNKNISGSGQQIDVRLSDEPAALTATQSCGGFLAGLECHCRVCSGDPAIACNSDADCGALGVGTCTSNGGGVSQVQPNACADLAEGFSCEQTDDGGGVCSISSTSFCDGFLRASGAGIIACAQEDVFPPGGNGRDDVCEAFDAECPDNNCGNCTITVPRPCFGASIDLRSRTNPGSNSAVLGSAFCHPPGISPSVNAAFGWPGPATMTLALDLDVRCDDGLTQYVYGGISCP